MEKISPFIVKELREVNTTDLGKISDYVKIAHDTVKGTPEDAKDRNSLNPFLVSLNKDFVAQYNKDVGGVGFYKIEKENNLVTFRHTSLGEIRGVEFPILEEVSIDAFNDVLPQGDVIIKFSDNDIFLPDNESVIDVINHYADNDLSSVEAVYYTGLSRNETEIRELDLDYLYTYIGDLYDDEDAIDF